MTRIGIIGGGFSGTLVLANMVKEAAAPLEIHWFERHPALAEGVAYGTKDTQHLLNVRADKMGAFAGQPEGFWHWLQKQGYPFAANDFAPRAVYALYLRSILDEALEQAEKKKITVHRHRVEVRRAERLAAEIVLDGAWRVDALVLATGNGAPRDIGLAGGHYVGNIWEAEGAIAQVQSLPPESEIAIIGTGLTTVDSILTLRSHGYRGRIAAISRNGLFPLPHALVKPYPAWEWVQHPEKAPKTVLGLMVGLRMEVRKAAAQGYDWRAVVDSLRPVTQTLWKQLDNNQKSIFFRRVFTLWNIHRHRMAPELDGLLRQWQNDGSLRVFSKKTPYDYARATLVINCTGPDYEVAKQPLFAGLVAPGPLGKGILDDPARGVYAIGPLLVGELLECTAVPELRERALQVAKAILAASQR